MNGPANYTATCLPKEGQTSPVQLIKVDIEKSGETA